MEEVLLCLDVSMYTNTLGSILPHALMDNYQQQEEGQEGKDLHASHFVSMSATCWWAVGHEYTLAGVVHDVFLATSDGLGLLDINNYMGIVWFEL